MNEKLKSCPFCGGKGELCKCYGAVAQRDFYLVMCEKCRARTDIADTPQKAIDLWQSNRR